MCSLEKKQKNRSYSKKLTDKQTMVMYRYIRKVVDYTNYKEALMTVINNIYKTI